MHIESVSKTIDHYDKDSNQDEPRIVGNATLQKTEDEEMQEHYRVFVINKAE